MGSNEALYEIEPQSYGVYVPRCEPEAHGMADYSVLRATATRRGQPGPGYAGNQQNCQKRWGYKKREP